MDQLSIGSPSVCHTGYSFPSHKSSGKDDMIQDTNSTGLKKKHICLYIYEKNILLVGGFNPFEKYARQIGSFPQVGVKIKNIVLAASPFFAAETVAFRRSVLLHQLETLDLLQENLFF